MDSVCDDNNNKSEKVVLEKMNMGPSCDDDNNESEKVSAMKCNNFMTWSSVNRNKKSYIQNFNWFQFCFDK